MVGDIPDQTIPEDSTFATINLDNYVSDADNTDAEVTWTYSGNTDLTVTIDVNRVATVTIPADWNGAEVITFRATDPGLLFDEDAATFTVSADNDPPVVDDIPDQTVDEGSTFTTISLDDYVSDADNTDEEITWTYGGNTELTVSIDVNRVATIGIPGVEWNGVETITFTATDPGLLSDGNAATFTVNAVNDPPVVGDIPGQTIDEGQSFLTINLDDYVSDIDHTDDQMTWTYSGNVGLTVSIDVNRVATIGIPDVDWNGTENITFTATDPALDSAGDSATFTVNSINDPPVVDDIPDQTIEEGQTFLSINLDDYVSDPDHADDQITWTWIGNNELTVDITNRVATIGIPNAEWNGFETITFTATDPDLAADSDAATFTVNPFNDPPTAGDDEVLSMDEGGTTTINLVANDNDVDGSLDLTSIVITLDPNFGTIVDNDNGTVDYIHNGSENFSDSFSYTIDDDQGKPSNEAGVTITITPVNDVPVVGDIPDQTVSEGGTFATITLDDYVTDPDNADTEITWTFSGSTELIVDITNRVATITIPDINWNGEEAIAFTATDPGLLSAGDAALFRVISDNDPPVAVADSFSVDEGATGTLDLADNDYDIDDGLDYNSIVIESGPTYGSVVVNNNDTGTVDYTHNGSETVVDSFTYTIKDLAGLTSDEVTVDITINPINDDPVANDDNLAAIEGEITNLNLAGNDTDAENGLNLASIVITTDPLYGSYVVNNDGTVDYNHNGSETTFDSFTYTIEDDTGAISSEATVNLTITEVNDDPVAVDDSATVDEDAVVTIDLVVNDYDVDGTLDLSSIVIVSNPSSGTILDNGDGTVEYTHDGSETIFDSFTYTINDDLGAPSNVATVSIDVTPVNDAPVAGNDSFTVAEGSDTALNLVANDSDAEDGLVLTSISILPGPSNGTLVDNGDGTVNYTHDGTETISDSFTYTIEDDIGVPSSPATVTLTITPVNDAPVADDGALTTDEDIASGDILSASDVDSSSWTYSIVTNGSRGTAVITNPSTGAYTYTPDLNEYGADTFTFKVNDGLADSNTATVDITINPINDAPVAETGALALDEDTLSGGTLIASDVDDVSVTYTLVSNGSKGTVTITDAATGAYTYSPILNANGPDSFTFLASDDDQEDSNEATVNIFINPVNDVPVAYSDTRPPFDEDTSQAGVLSADDVDGDVLTYSIASNGTIGQATITNNRTGAYTYVPFPNANGSDSFTFRVYDGTVNSDAATIDLDVTPVNDPPDIPVALLPDENETLDPDNVVLEASAFHDLDDDIIAADARIHWKIRRFDQIAPLIEEEFSGDLDQYTAIGLSEGMKYAWQVGYEDQHGVQSWSHEYTFKLGTSVTDNTIQIEPGIELADFKMVSYPQWPDQIMADDAFSDAVVGNYDYNYRIGTYDPNTGEYIQYGENLELEPGTAYWMIARDGLNAANDGVLVTTDFELYVALENGWKMVGPPNATNYLWDEVQVIEYDAAGNVVFGPETIGSLSNPNSYIDKRLWRWENGVYVANTTVMEAYEGYWVKAKKDNLYLMFDVDAQTTLTNQEVPPASVRAAANADDVPPRPIYGFDGDEAGQSGRNGCFVETLENDFSCRNFLIVGVLLILLTAMAGRVIKRIRYRGGR